MPTAPSAACLAPLDLEKIAKAYDSEPWWYDVRGFLILTFAYRSTLWEQLRLFSANLDERHLEVAIGSGTLFGMVLKRARRAGRAPRRVVGCDYAERMLAGAIRRFATDPLIELGIADVGSMPYPDAGFDSVNVANAMHCFPDIALALRELHRVLRPGGRLAVNVLLHPRGGWPWRGIAARINRWGAAKGIVNRPYDREEVLAAVAAAGLELEREWVSGNVCNLLARRPD